MRRARQTRRKPSATRIVGYHFEGRIDVPAAERVLSRAAATGVVTQYVAKHYSEADCVWFNGPPGAELRAVRDEIRRIVR